MLLNDVFFMASSAYFLSSSSFCLFIVLFLHPNPSSSPSLLVLILTLGLHFSFLSSHSEPFGLLRRSGDFHSLHGNQIQQCHQHWEILPQVSAA